LSFRITEGQRHDIVPAPELVRETKPRCLLGDKAYSTVAFRAELAALGCVAVIPSSSSWINRTRCTDPVWRRAAEAGRLVG
jgi:hypothetical protein